MEELRERLIKCLCEKDYERFELLFLRAVVYSDISRKELSDVLMHYDILYKITFDNLAHLFRTIYPFLNIGAIDKPVIIEHCNRNESWLIMEHIETMENPINKIKKVNESIEGKYKHNKEDVDINDTLVIAIKYPIHWNDALNILDKHGIIYSKYYDPYDAMVFEFAKKMIHRCCFGKGMPIHDIESLIEPNIDFAYELYYNRVVTEDKMIKLEEHIFNPKTYDNVYKFKAK